jgi:RHH-type rel operon transcriptional repressor/antitoxin RelB
MDEIQTSIIVPKDLHRRALAMAESQGHTFNDIVSDALEEYLEELEDIAIAKETLARIRRGEERTYSQEEVWRR